MFRGGAIFQYRKTGNVKLNDWQFKFLKQRSFDMSKTCSIKLLFGLSVFILCMILLHGENITRQENLKNDSVAFLKNDIAFHVSFDSKNPGPDMGELEVKKVKSNLEYAPGLSGQAILISGQPTAAAEYQPPHPLFQGTGSICFWVMPQSWIQRGTSDSRSYIVFLRATVGNGSLIIERQGFSTNPKRMDYLLILLNKAMEGTPLAVADATEKWEDGTWHLVVINWDEKGFDASIDGRDLKRTNYSRPLAKSDFTGQEKFTVGYGEADSTEKTLLDEITVFKRPLTQVEIRKIYKTGLANIASDTPTLQETKKKNEPSSPASPGTSWNTKVIKTEARIPFITPAEVPKIDGSIGEDEWAAALKEIGGYKNAFDLEPRECSYHIASDGKKIYIAIRSELPPTKQLIANNQPQGDKDIPQVCNDDSVEVWLMPDKNAGHTMYAVIANSLGAVYDFTCDPQSKKMDASWRSKAEFTSKIVGNEWHAEIAIPASSLGRAVVEENLPYGIHIVRNFKRPAMQANWTPNIGAFNNPDNMGTVTWDKKAPLVRFTSALSADKKKIELAFEAENKGEKDVSIVVDRYWQCAGNTDFTAKEEILLKAGQKRTFTLVKNAALGGLYFVFFNAVSPDNSKTYFSRKFIWQTMRGDDAWTVEESTSDIRFWYGYYPYYNKIKTKIDISGMKDRDAVTGALVRVSGKKGSVIVETPYPPFSKFVSEFTFDIPALKEGEYIIEAFLVDGKGQRQSVASREFKRKIFEWEGNKLGISDEVIPPFTPLKVSGKKVESVLRTHILNDIGLPEQIVSDGRNILAGPVSLLVEIDGRKETVRADKPLSFTRAQKNEVRYQTSWKAGALNGKMDAFFDYDGMLKIKLDLTLPEKSTFSRCDLVIPVTSETARLMHILSDTGKASFTGKIPAGDNPVWESLFVDHCQYADNDGIPWRLPGTFVPYVWIGDEDRGISWYAESDRDWLTNDKKSEVEINRQKDRTEIVVHFVTKPGTLKRTHSIVFALQATPTKPMPVTPAPWRDIVFSMPQLSNQYNASIIGAALQWGGDDYYVFYPRNKDYTIFNLIQETRNGRHDSAAWDKWAEGYDQRIPFVDRIKRNIRNGEGIARSKPQTIIPYTDMRGISVREEDFKVFLDEWMPYDYSPKKWPEFDESGTFGYDAIACRSRQDYILWYFNKMLDSGAMDAIYYDVTYPRAIRNSLSGNAYYDETGKMRTACDIFETRELFKRSAVLAWQKRKYNLNVAHMSFTLISPVHSWAGVILDWESRYGMDDFQDRFNRDYIHAVSLGRQVGAMPIACGSLGINGDPARRPWVNRTLTGVLVTHEIKDWAVGWGKDKIYENTLKTLYDFGYGSPECAVNNYWQKNYPASVKGIDSASLLLTKNGEALMVITDYGNGGKCELTLDAAALKLKKDGKFYNADNGKIVPGAGSACSFDLKKHDFIILHYR
jgi:hypothetical protein